MPMYKGDDAQADVLSGCKKNSYHTCIWYMGDLLHYVLLRREHNTAMWEEEESGEACE